MKCEESYIHFLSSSPLLAKNRNVAAFFFFSSTGALGKGFEAGDIEESLVEVRRIGGAGGLSSSDILLQELSQSPRSSPNIQKSFSHKVILKIPALKTCVSPRKAHTFTSSARDLGSWSVRADAINPPTLHAEKAGNYSHLL